MHKNLVVLWLCCACAQHARFERSEPQVMVASAGSDTLTAVERARSLEAAVRFRRMIFVEDTTIRVEGCSVALVLGPMYPTLLTPHFRSMVSEPADACGTKPGLTGFTRRLVLRSIEGGGGEALVSITFHGGGSYFHEEDFKVRRASSRPDGLWAGIEMRVYDAIIVD